MSGEARMTKSFYRDTELVKAARGEAFGREVKIPFLPEFEQAMLSGRKTMTSRTKWYGKAGDYFEAFGARFTIVMQSVVPLETITSLYYRQEGVGSPDEFKAVWVRLHPRLGWQPELMVKLHRFRLQQEVTGGR